MKAESIHFEPDQLQRFLDSNLSAAEQQDMERHLEICDVCRERLHTSAAEVTWWEDVSDYLNDDEFEIGTGTHVDSGASTPAATWVQTSDRVSAEGDEIPSGVRQIIAWLDPTDDPAMLGRLGGYEIAGVIGAGGMGVVLKGFDRPLNRYVAVKILAPHLATSGAARKRFAREAQAAAAVVHMNVIAIHGVDEANGLPYLVMPYLRGTSLQRRIDERGPLSVPEILRLGMQTARGLAAAHDQGLVHRDIKPANILLDGTTERVLLTDFGLARAADDASLTHSGVIAGTPYFMSPEQAEGAAIDHRSDLFSLGSVLYAMCTGRPPFRADTSWGILRKVTDSQPHSIRDLNPEVPVWLCEVIRQLHQKTPDSRIQTAFEVAQLLEQCLAHVQQPNDFSIPQQLTAHTAHSAQNPGRPVRIAAISGIAIACTATLVWAVWGPSDSNSDSGRLTGSPNPQHSARIESSTDPDPQEIPLPTPVVTAGDPNLDTADDRGLDWDDGTNAELASIRQAVNELTVDSLQIIDTTLTVRRNHADIHSGDDSRR